MIPDWDREGVAAVGTAIEILEHVESRNGARISEIAEAIDLSKGAVHKHLSTLVEHEYVVQEGDEYNLGLRFAYLGDSATARKETYTKLRRLAKVITEETGLESGVIVEENGRGAYLKAESEGTADPKMFPRVGGRTYLHATAAGKAILAHLPARRVDDIVDRWGLPALTEHTITDRETLDADLERIRERGYAFNEEENRLSLQAVATVVHDADGTVLGGLGVTSPQYKEASEWFRTQVPETLCAHRDEFEAQL